jgi:regulator of nucleoside diphosphate kinase
VSRQREFFVMFQTFSGPAAPGGARASGLRTEARPLIPSDHYARIAGIAFEAAEAGDPNGLRLLARIRAAEQCEPDDLPDDVVSMDGFVTYRTEGGLSRTHALIYPEDRMWSPAEISVLTPLGTALLGQRAGDRIGVEGAADAWTLTISIEKVGRRRMTGGFVRVGGRAPSPPRSSVLRTSSPPGDPDLQHADLKRAGLLIAGT